MASITKAIIPAAGRGMRLRLITDYLPKPMLPLGRKPVLQHIVEELQEGDVNEILIVLHPEQEMVKHYFSKFEGLSFVVDGSFGGPGSAILAGEDFINDESFVIVFADAPLGGKNRNKTLGDLIDKWKAYEAEALLSIYAVPAKEVSSRGIVDLLEEPRTNLPVKIKSIVEKPEAKAVEGNRHWATACRYVVSGQIFSALRNAEPDQNGELQLTAGINHLLQEKGEVYGLPLPEGVKRYDTGTFEGYHEAIEAFT